LGKAAGLLFLALIVSLLAFEIYVVIVQRAGDASPPPLLGNFTRIRASLTRAPPKEEFTFAVMGDTQSTGIFERIAERLRESPVDFAVLLGDAFKGSRTDLRYFRSEWAEELALPFPVFFVAGNHDLEQISRAEFERLFGPSLFSFEYQGALFIALRIIGDPVSDEESIAFLRSFLPREANRRRKIFVFMHIPPPVPSFDTRKFVAPRELLALFKELHVAYVFAGHHHGYARTVLDGTTYIVSGAAGERLDDDRIPQFHHAVVVRVGRDYAAERILHVRRTRDLEDVVERFALASAYPWLRENWVVAGVANLILVGTAAYVGMTYLGRGVRLSGDPARDSPYTGSVTDRGG